MNAKTITAIDPYFFEGEIPGLSMMDDVRNQAIEHTHRLKESQIVKDARPSEDSISQEYRNKIIRDITRAPIDKFKTKTTRIVLSSGFAINPSSTSDALRENLESQPYYYLERNTDVLTYFFDCVYDESISDPNAILVDFPYNRNNPFVAPALPVELGGNPSNQPISVETKIVYHSELRYIDRNMFSWYGGQVTIQHDNKKRTFDWFWIVDNEWFYQYVPVSVDKKTDKAIYELQGWYRHDTGIGNTKELPYNPLPGKLAKDIQGSMYQESLLSGYFPYADEFKSRFSDAQAVWNQHGYPKVIMKEAPCMEASCKGGWVNGEDHEGQPTRSKCGVCSGTGVMSNPHPYSVIIRKQNTMDDDKSGKPYELIAPPDSSLKTTYEIPFDILDKGKKEIGLDVLEDIAESGAAKGKRLEDIKDILAMISDKMAIVMERSLFFRECLLNVNRSSRKKPSVSRPTDFDLKTTADLKEEARESLDADKFLSNMRVYEKQYKNDPKTLRVYELSLKYSPILMDSWEVVKDKELMGVISDNDIIKRDNAVQVLLSISANVDILNITDEKAFELVDQAMIQKGLLPDPTEVFEGENNTDTDDTISRLNEGVRTNRIDRQSAINTAVLITGRPLEEIEQLIQPIQNDEQDTAQRAQTN